MKESSNYERVNGTGDLPLKTIVNYNIPTVGVGFMFSSYPSTWMKFSTDVLLISPAVMGSIFGISFDMGCGHRSLAGYLSDRTTLKQVADAPGC